jgi:hypothetical protein
VSSQKSIPTSLVGSFRVSGKAPELWNAINGSVRDLPAYVDDGTTTSVPLELAPYESAFIVFRKKSVHTGVAAANTHAISKVNYPSLVRVMPVNGSWTVYFDHLSRGPVYPVVFDSLTDWSKNVNDSIKYYSGTAWYHNTFHIDSLSAGSHYVLDLGGFSAIAKVTVNGQYMGGVWTLPYQVDITKALHPGINKLEIKVVNTWMNRLVGDARLPVAQRKTSVLYGPGAQSGLEASGLFGPVVVREER